MNYKKKLLFFRVALDIVMTAAAWFSAFFLRFHVIPGGQGNPIMLFSILAVAACVITLWFCNIQGLYDSDAINTFQNEAGKLLKVSIYVFLAFVCVYYFIFVNKVSRVTLALFLIFHFLFMLTGRRLINGHFARQLKKRPERIRTLLVGSGSGVENYARMVSEDKESGNKVVGQYMANGCGLDDVEQIDAASLSEAVGKVRANLVVIADYESDFDAGQRILNESLDLFDQMVMLLPAVPKSYVGTSLSMFHGIPVIRINSFEQSAFGRIGKRLFDLVACTAGVLVFSPLLLLIAILVKATSKGPVFFKQKRVTRDGKVFQMLKFRSMRIDMPEGDPHWTEENDPRITKIGRFIRRTSLDELPQFFNVIGGSMSLIGPRPERPELEKGFMETIPGYNMRHKMKAGISGWAQVNGLRGNTSIEKRIDYDLYYIRNWSFMFDLKIVIFTFFKGFINKNAY